MSAQSGITPSREILERFTTLAQDHNSLFVKLEIKDATFVIAGEGQKKSSVEEDFASMQAVLEKNCPSYVLYKASDHEWTCITYIPDGSPVRLKMIYASSKAALKQGLGDSKFSKEDYAISDASECSAAEFKKQMAGSSREISMSSDERMHKETIHQASNVSGESRVSAIVGIPIKVADSVIDALNGIKNGAHDTVELIIDPTTETLSNANPDNTRLVDLAYPQKEPRFFVHNFSHSNGGEPAKKLLFIYYCPNKAIPKHKMLYSTCKANIIKLFHNLQIEDFHNLEANEPDELSEEEVLKDLYPKAVDDRAFKKPSARGRGKQTIAKFQGI